MMVGPRNSIVARIQGKPFDWTTDTSPWSVFSGRRWQILEEYPELWVDKIHDYVADDDD